MARANVHSYGVNFLLGLLMHFMQLICINLRKDCVLMWLIYIKFEER